MNVLEVSLETLILISWAVNTSHLGGRV